MEIIVEIGTSEQQELIKNELQAIFGETSKIDPDLRVNKVIVPADFDATVNKLLEKSNYQSVRNFGEYQITAQAKIVNTPGGFCIVISSRIFNEQQDLQTRCFIYIHEFTHLINSSKLQVGEANTQSDSIYAHNLKIFIDEYIADRKAYSVVNKIFPIKSELWKIEVDRQAAAFAVVLTDPKHMQGIKASIRQLQVDKDIKRFLSEAGPLFDGIFLSLAHSFSLSDSCPNQLPLSELAKSEFVNERTIALIDYARHIYSNADYRFSEGLLYIKEFMRNFGIALSDSSQGLICHVDYTDF